LPLVGPDVSEPIALITAAGSPEVPTIIEAITVCRALAR
jgi:hypothetical protein